MTISRKVLICLAFMPLIFLASYYLVFQYVYGDQVYYRAFYEALSTSSFDKVMNLSSAHLSSGEPLSSYLLWFGAASGLDKDLYIAALNTVFIIAMLLFLVKNRVSPIFIFLLLVNYYIIVLLTGAERLKFAYLVLVFAALANGWFRYFWLMISPAAHFQALIFIPAIVSYSFFRPFFLTLVAGKLKIKIFLLALAAVSAILFFFSIFSSDLIYKASQYARYDLDISSLLQIFILLLITFPLLKDRPAALVVFAYFSCVILMIGETRVNMIAFTVLTYFLIKEGVLSGVKINNIPYLAVLLYFAYKSFFFVVNVVSHGDGFYSG